MIGFLAGLRSYPHLLGADVLRIRNGALHDIAISWAAISRVTIEDRSLPSSMWVLQHQETEHGLHQPRPAELTTRRVSIATLPP